MAGDTLGIGFVGSGWISRAHAHALQTLNHIAPLPKRIRLVAVSSRRPEPARALASELGFERFTTRWEDVVADEAVDVVAVLAADPAHAPASIAALDAGKPVLCEKPLAVDAAEAARMLAAAEAAGVPHACGFNYRYVPAVRLMYELASRGRLGALRHFRAVYLQDWAAGTTATRPSHGGSGAVGDYSHLLDLVLHLCGQPLGVSGHAASFVSPVADAYVAALDLPGGALGSLEASRCATGWKGRQRIELNGELGAAWWDMEDLSRLHVYLTRDEAEGLAGFRSVLVTDPGHPFMAQWWPPGHVIGWEHTLTHQWRDFLTAVLDGRPVPPEQASFEDGWRAAVLADAIVKAAAEGRRVEVSDARPSTPIAGSTAAGGATP